MTKSWHSAEFTLRDSGDDRDGTLSAYLKYDLCAWTFGLRFELDPGWYDFHIDVGPIELSFIYWRQHVVVLDL